MIILNSITMAESNTQRRYVDREFQDGSLAGLPIGTSLEYTADAAEHPTNPVSVSRRDTGEWILVTMGEFRALPEERRVLRDSTVNPGLISAERRDEMFLALHTYRQPHHVKSPFRSTDTNSDAIAFAISAGVNRWMELASEGRRIGLFDLQELREIVDVVPNILDKAA